MRLFSKNMFGGLGKMSPAVVVLVLVVVVIIVMMINNSSGFGAMMPSFTLPKAPSPPPPAQPALNTVAGLNNVIAQAELVIKLGNNDITKYESELPRLRAWVNAHNKFLNEVWTRIWNKYVGKLGTVLMGSQWTMQDARNGLTDNKNNYQKKIEQVVYFAMKIKSLNNQLQTEINNARNIANSNPSAATLQTTSTNLRTTTNMVNTARVSFPSNEFYFTNVPPPGYPTREWYSGVYNGQFVPSVHDPQWNTFII